ncbi:MAG TPA: LacI family DNA-binding transcriptional regulator [Candidatus Paenibacillus intestinavium]|nr:LacI family DNA-binding transcriptional regulator [Candidatus Paenibacillus intestinavium]
MSKKITMQQIANYLGVSKFVVSKALSGKAGVSDHTKERVIEAASQLGYFSQKNAYMKPNRVETNVRSQGSSKQSVLVLMPNIRFQTKESLYWGRILDGVSAELEQRGIGMVILSEQSIDHFTQFINLDGILGIIGIGEISSTMLLEIHRLGMTMVLVDHEDYLIPADSIFVDNYEATYRLTKQLIGTGHNEIVFVGNTQFSRSFYDRFLGYRAAMEEQLYRQQKNDGEKITSLSYSSCIDRSFLNIEGFESEQFAQQLKQWITRQKVMPTAIVCGNDAIALGAVQMLQALGINVPEQISVSGFDNIEDSYRLSPALTTVHVPKETLGKKAVERLLNRLATPDEPIVKILVKSELIYRDSTAARE